MMAQADRRLYRCLRRRAIAVVREQNDLQSGSPGGLGEDLIVGNAGIDNGDLVAVQRCVFGRLSDQVKSLKSVT